MDEVPVSSSTPWCHSVLLVVLGWPSESTLKTDWNIHWLVIYIEYNIAYISREARNHMAILAIWVSWHSIYITYNPANTSYLWGRGSTLRRE